MGEQLFPDCTRAGALHALRAMLEAIGFSDFELYRTHDLRRGHARDPQDAGTPLAKLLERGQLATPAFLKYLDLQFLERDIVIQAHVDESSSDSD